MNISFIITTYNIETYIGRCLESVLEVATAGDEIIVVDDGSSDGTPQIVTDILKGKNCPDRVEVQTLFLGENTMGGVGIAGNIGMDKATKDCVFFVDGDDWLDADGFRYARKRFSKGKHDILIANYQVFDEAKNTYKAPADEWRWCRLSSGADPQLRQLQALRLIAVPWRKFYRRGFLEQNELRFPEGDYFFEDNPFHWNVCLNTDQIDFLDVTLCYHRINRPGQTMASTGAELAAFFDHFQTIQTYLSPETPPQFRTQLIAWIVGNMSWHLERLQPEAAPQYFRKAEAACKHFTKADLPEDLVDSDAALYVILLQDRSWEAALENFLSQHNRKELRRIHRSASRAKQKILKQFRPVRSAVVALRNCVLYAVHYASYQKQKDSAETK